MAYFRKRGDKWSFTVDVGTDPATGKRKQKTVSGYKTKKEAEKACAELVTEIDRGNITINATNDTLGEFMKSFLETSLSQSIEQNTLEGKASIMRKHIIPRIGHIKLNKLTPIILQKFYNELGDSGVAAGSIQNLSRLINQTLQTAVTWGYITKNVNSLVRKPTYKQRKMEVWTKDQYEQFLHDVKESPRYVYYLIALNTGMRPGEIKALSWDQIDFKKNIIRVERTVVYSKKFGLRIKLSPKNDASIRNVTVPSHVIHYLKRYRLEQLPNKYNLLLPGVESDIMYPATMHEKYKEDLQLTKVPHIGLHDMRHTHATYLLSPPPFGLGIGVKAVSERLGHAKATTTLNTYTHVLPNMQDAIAEKLEDSSNNLWINK